MQRCTSPSPEQTPFSCIKSNMGVFHSHVAVYCAAISVLINGFVHLLQRAHVHNNTAKHLYLSSTQRNITLDWGHRFWALQESSEDAWFLAPGHQDSGG